MDYKQFCIDKEHLTAEEEEEEFNGFRKCIGFMRDDLNNCGIIDWEILYFGSELTDKQLYERVVFLKHALFAGNKPAIDNFKKKHNEYPKGITQIHAVLWAVYVVSNHGLYWAYKFGRIPNSDEEGSYNFFQNMVDLFVEEKIEKPLLCLAISGERQREISNKSAEYSNVVDDNIEVVKMLVPKHIGVNDIVITGLTPWEYWDSYDNTLLNVFASWNFRPGCEVFCKNGEIGKFLKPELNATCVINTIIKIEK